jgi:hypothetical protein
MGNSDIRTVHHANRDQELIGNTMIKSHHDEGGDGKPQCQDLYSLKRDTQVSGSVILLQVTIPTLRLTSCYLFSTRSLPDTETHHEIGSNSL